LAQVLAHVGSLLDLLQLKAITDSLGDLRRRDLLVPGAVRDLVDERDRLPDPLRRGPAGHGISRSPACGVRPRPGDRAPRRCWSCRRPDRPAGRGGLRAARTPAWRPA